MSVFWRIPGVRAHSADDRSAHARQPEWKGSPGIQFAEARGRYSTFPSRTSRIGSRSKKEMQHMATTHRFSAPYALGIAALCFFVAAPLLAEPQGPGEGSPRYDVATEATVTGTVEAVEQIAGAGGGRGRRGLGGTHIALKTNAETLEVHLGPTAFLNEKQVAIAKGDTLVIVGSRATVDGDRVFIAKEVKKGNSVWTLRDAAGLPLWRGRGGKQ
jgi:hypothetical protein